jgi:hypothetical protein
MLIRPGAAISTNSNSDWPHSQNRHEISRSLSLPFTNASMPLRHPLADFPVIVIGHSSQR